MTNITTTIVGRKLIIEINLDVPVTPSQTGKSEILASSNGFVPLRDLSLPNHALNLVLVTRKDRPWLQKRA